MSRREQTIHGGEAPAPGRSIANPLNRLPFGALPRGGHLFLLMGATGFAEGIEDVLAGLTSRAHTDRNGPCYDD